jgi:nitrate/nitrite transport system permease protein
MSSANDAVRIVAGDSGKDTSPRARAAESQAARTPSRFRARARVLVAAFWRRLAIPLIAITVFLLAWSGLAAGVQTSRGQMPGPVAVIEQAHALWADHLAERAKAAVFTAKPTFIDELFTSLKTMLAGFVLATLIAIPLGVLCGFSNTVNRALNPFIQLFKPVSPLAWLPLVTMVVSAVYVSENPTFEKSFVNSAVTVALCSLWPTIIHTALGVASIDHHLKNVTRGVQTGVFAKFFELVLPAVLPSMFTGLRLSLGVAWMVLIAAEMLAKNPGLGKFIWDEFQNGGESSLARILVAVFTIGLAGFLLDRMMYALQSFFSFGARR